MKSLILAAIFSLPAFATNEVVSYHAEVVSAVSPYSPVASSCASDYADVVASCHAGKSNVQFYAVADAGHCSHNDLVRVVRNRNVRVIVGKNQVQRSGLSGYNQTVVNCVRVVRRVGFRPVRSVVRRSGRIFGRLVGVNSRRVRVEVDACR